VRLDLTRRADYAIRATLALARAPDGERQSVSRIAAAERIPVRFLPQVMRDLVRAGLVEGATGRAGGYWLARRPDEVSLLDVIEAVEGDSRRRTCVLRGGPCRVDATCAVHDDVIEAQEALLLRLASARLGTAARRHA